MVTVDAADPRKLAESGAAALDTEIYLDLDYFVFLRPSPHGGPGLAFRRAVEPRTVKNRLHLDLAAAKGTMRTEAERLVGLGATMIAERCGQVEGIEWITPADPEGNEFCTAEHYAD